MQSYGPHQRLREVVADNPLLLPALSRFGISLGFGDNSVSTICKNAGVDTDTFLAVINLISGKPFEANKVDIGTLMNYLKSAHSYFLSYRLPDIRRRLIDGVCGGSADIAMSVMRFYDEYTRDVQRHMEYENGSVFGYVEELLQGRRPAHFRIADFKENHGPIDAKLREIKEILICHYTAETSRTDALNSLLFDVVVCERDLGAHCRVEDMLFIPAVERLESNVCTIEVVEADNENDTAGLDKNGDIVLTPRERDIITSIAQGLSNKETADKLCLSIHTVATHRRNICAKLNIHSASGLTIYAVIHGLIDMPA